MKDYCENCGSENIEWYPGHHGRPDEPDADPGWECVDCGHWMHETRTERMVCRAEFNEDSWND